MNSEPKEAIQLAVNSYMSKGFKLIGYRYYDKDSSGQEYLSPLA